MWTHREQSRKAAAILGIAIGLGYAMWKDYAETYRWYFLCGFVVFCAIIMWAERPSTMTPAQSDKRSAMRAALLTTLVLFLLIALFPVNWRSVQTPWGWSRWVFIGFAERLDWGIMALEFIAAGVIGAIVWVRKA